MNQLLAVSAFNGIAGWVLIAIGGLAMVLAIAASALEAFRKAFQSDNQIQSLAASDAKPWDGIFELIGQILKELMGKTGGPTFAMGFVAVCLGVLVLNEKLF